MMEAVRILKATGLKMRRTVRLALWTGEEQGLLGSRAYVSEHFGDRRTTGLKPEHSKLSVYFNADSGSGAFRGIFVEGNEAVVPIFSAWIDPLRNIGMTTVSLRSAHPPYAAMISRHTPSGGGGTDHFPFDQAGLLGFAFVQDPLEYETRTHHSSADVFERVQPADMMKSAVIAAFLVYQAANREDLLPRKPLSGN